MPKQNRIDQEEDKNKRSRGHVFTWNNYTDATEAMLKKQAKNAVYMIYGKEIAPTTGTPHLQGYIYYKNCRVSRAVSKKLGGCYTHVAYGSPEQNTGYCSKDKDEIVKYGSEPKKGERNDLTSFVTAVQESEKVLEEEILLLDYTKVVAMYPRFVDRVQRHFHPPTSNSEMDNHWFYGPPGTGKSYTACSMGSYYIKMPVKWYDGYSGETNLILEEVEPIHARELSCPLKVMADLRPFTAEIKGSTVFIRPKRIIVTSNYSIDDMGWDEITTKAMKRRFQERLFDVVYEA